MPPSRDDLRDCICADPWNCREAVPGYRCRKFAVSKPPPQVQTMIGELTPDQAIKLLGYIGQHIEGACIGYSSNQLQAIANTIESQRQALLTLQQEKDLGASMLARQCDLAREAETQLEGVMAERDHYRLANAQITASLAAHQRHAFEAGFKAGTNGHMYSDTAWRAYLASLPLEPQEPTP